MSASVTSLRHFHTNCLKNGSKNNCPVCYYKENPYLIENYVCMMCGTKDMLWFCITCGHVGCGHQVQRHALEHYGETKHVYVMGLKEFKVYDYKTKQFLHLFNENELKVSNTRLYSQVKKGDNCLCAVCQHNRNPKLMEKATCMDCKESLIGSLWICMDCFHIGCSRIKNKHALQHFKNTQHTYAMQMHNFSIWDYQASKFQHRSLFKCITFKSEAKIFQSDYKRIL